MRGRCITCPNAAVKLKVERRARKRTTHEDFLKFIGKKTPDYLILFRLRRARRIKGGFAITLKPFQFPVVSLIFVCKNSVANPAWNETKLSVIVQDEINSRLSSGENQVVKSF